MHSYAGPALGIGELGGRLGRQMRWGRQKRWVALINQLMNFNETSEIKHAVQTRFEMERIMGGTGEHKLLNCY